MKNPYPLIKLQSCPKSYTQDLDKSTSPNETIKNVKTILANLKLDIISETRRIDNGRLGIPVYLSICGNDAKAFMPTRKQMGKGSSSAQAEASAIMELIERFSFFSFWENNSDFFVNASWTEAVNSFSSSVISIENMLKAVNDNLDFSAARTVLDVCTWKFYPATFLKNETITWLPLDWFRLLGEFNGTSAGNSTEESILQGLCELVERHVCSIIDSQRLVTPCVDISTCNDHILQNLFDSFRREGINLILKDFSLNMPIPTVAALAWDNSTFPHSSEIVFTAGSASSPAKAAIRAITEIAQLAGDFCTKSCYEASGLPKFTRLEDINWLLQGPTVSLYSLPSVEAEDIHDELLSALTKISYIDVYSVETTNKLLNIPAHYTIAPGFAFRERDRNQSLGLFVGRKLVEQEDKVTAEKGLKVLSKYYPNAHFLPFFQGMLLLRSQDYQTSHDFFVQSIKLQPDNNSMALANFYAAYTLTLLEKWQKAIPFLEKAHNLCNDMKEISNLLGVSYFKQKNYEKAANIFESILRVDKGSAIDLANLGICHKYMKNYEEAYKYLNAGLSLDPQMEFARQHLKSLKNFNS